MQPLAIAGARRVQPLQYLDLPLRTELTGEALAAAFVLEEQPQPPQHIAQVRRLIEDHDRARTETAARRAQILETQRHVDFAGQEKCPRRAAHQHRF